MSVKTLYRLFYLIIIYGNAYLLIFSKSVNSLLLEIVPFIIFGILIIQGINAFSSDMPEIMAKNEKYVKAFSEYAFSPQFRFLSMIVAGLTFSYYNYDIYAFFIILAGAEDAVLQKRTFDLLSGY